MAESILVPKTVTVPFTQNGVLGTITLKKLPLGKLDALGKATANLVNTASSLASGSGEGGLAGQIGSLMSGTPQQIAGLASILTGLDAQVFLDADDPDEVMEIIGAGAKLNNASELFKSALGKMLGTVQA